MKRRELAPSIFGLTLVLSLAALGDSGEDGARDPLYFDQEPPGAIPVVFAPGIISLQDRFEQFLLYSPDERQLIFSVTDENWASFTLESLRFDGAEWTAAETAPFLGSSPDGLVAQFSYDLRRVFFTSSRPAYPPVNIWMSERSEAGWAEPIMVAPPVSSDGNEFEVAISRNGTLYFSSSRNGGHGELDLYRARPVDGRYPTIENLGPVINSSASDDLPYIAPDESYLLFGSTRDGGRGKIDLYVSFQVSGRWTRPLNLGPTINTEGYDNYPSVSPDGRYLFFTRRKEWVTSEDSDIYWVSARLIDRLRDEAVGSDR